MLDMQEGVLGLFAEQQERYGYPDEDAFIGNHITELTRRDQVRERVRKFRVMAFGGHALVTHVCLGCGCEFRRDRRAKGPKRIYHSDACRNKTWYSRAKELSNE